MLLLSADAAQFSLLLKEFEKLSPRSGLTLAKWHLSYYS
jgi:hypothetical protein